MRFKQKKEEEPILGITPLIDIVFLLLIFFMLTSHFHVASGVPIRLPKVTQNAYDSKNQKIILAIDPQKKLKFELNKNKEKTLEDPTSYHLYPVPSIGMAGVQ